MKSIPKYIYSFITLPLVTVPVLFLFHSTSFSDTVIFKDGSQAKGVMLKEEDDRIIFTTEKGDEVIKKETFDRIVYDTDEANTLLLAGYAEKTDVIKAFYLYEKAYRMDPESEKAVQGMMRFQNSVYKNSEGRALAVNYERYQTPVDNNVKESDLSSRNAVDTEKVQKELGIILATKDFRQNTASTYYTKVKVVDVVSASRAYEAGVRLGDYLVNIEGYAGGRMGLYDAVSLLAKHLNGPISIVVERNIDIFVQQEDTAVSVFKITGLDVEEGGTALMVTVVKDGSTAFASGLRAGDIVVSADYGSIRLAVKADLENVLKTAMPGNAHLAIRRKIEIK